MRRGRPGDGTALDQDGVCSANKTAVPSAARFCIQLPGDIGLERSRPVSIRWDTRKAEVLERKWPRGPENGGGRLDLALGLGPAVLGEAWASWPRPWPHDTATSSPVAGASGCGYN